MSGASVGWRLGLGLLRRLPQGALSRAWGRMAELALPAPLQKAVNRAFAGLVGVDLEESEKPPECYATLSAFFSRRMRKGIRAWPPDSEMPASPVDGILGSFGYLNAGTVLQAKGVAYRAADLFGDEDAAGDFGEGLYFTIYLSPRHYHRIHAPLAGEIVGARAIPGRLLPVNQAATASVPDLFPRNERLVVHFATPIFPVALVAIGAYNVGRISAEFDPEWNGREPRGVTNRRGRRGPDLRVYRPPIPVARGDEVMAFHLGSTVVLFLGGSREPRPEPSGGLAEGMELRLGTPLLAQPFGDSTVR